MTTLPSCHVDTSVRLYLKQTGPSTSSEKSLQGQLRFPKGLDKSSFLFSNIRLSVVLSNTAESFFSPNSRPCLNRTVCKNGTESVVERKPVMPHVSLAGNTWPPEGDTAGAVFVMDGVTLSAGSRDLIDGAAWRLMPGERAGLVGVNGCGKSTLLRAITGNQPFDSGRMVVSFGTKLGYLEQTAVSGSKQTVWDEARSRMDAINEADEELRVAELSVDKGEEGAIAKLAAAQEAFEAADGYKADEMIAGVLNGLGFQQSDWTRLCSEFSGGWQMRIALARLLLGQMDRSGRSLMLLDEPTNHLDNKAKAWLAEYLRKVPGAVIIVSHDEALLDRTCDRIAEIRNGQLHTYVGNYTKFLREREARQLALAQEIQSKQLEIDKLQGFVDRFGAKATKAAAANSKKKAIAKLQASMPAGLPEKVNSNSGGDRRIAVVKLPPTPVCAREVLILRKGVIGWEGSSPLLQNVDLKLETGMRLMILGPNGCGKSTLLRALSGRGALQGGEREEGMGVQLGVFTQDLAQDLPQDVSGLECVLQIAREKDPTITDETARSALGALGLTGDSVLRPIKALSGGEKARVALGAFVLKPHNVLLMDEASNHLDRPTVRALAKALSTFKGALVAITHDREFCEAINPTHVARVLPNGTVSVRLCINGELDDRDFNPTAPVESSQSNGSSGNQQVTESGKKKVGNVKEERKRLQQMQNRIAKLLSYIEKGEEACRGYDKELSAAGSNAEKALKILKIKEEVLDKVREFEEEWEELEAKAEELRDRLSPQAV